MIRSYKNVDTEKAWNRDHVPADEVEITDYH